MPPPHHPPGHPDAKARLNYLLHTSPTPSTRLAALSLEHNRDAHNRTPEQHTRTPTPAPLLPPLLPVRARSADSVATAPFTGQYSHVPHASVPGYAAATRAESGFSDVSPSPSRREYSGGSGGSLSGCHSLSSGPSLPALNPQGMSMGMSLAGMNLHGAQGKARRTFKTEQELRDKREQRRMKNRISAARSRQRKTDTFETMQRELTEAKNVIEALTLQLDRMRGGREWGGLGGGGGPVVVAVPHDLKGVVERDFVSADFLMDLLRLYIRRSEE